MNRVIKQDQAAAARPVAFNFEDLKAKGERYLAAVRAEAQKILAEARAQAAQIRAQAEAEGRRRGMEAGREQMQALVGEQVRQQLTTLLPALQEAANQLRQAREDCLAYWQKAVIRVAVAMAERILRSQLDRQPEIPFRYVREALELAATSPQIEIRLHPEDRKALESQLSAVLAAVQAAGKASVVADPSISRGGCRVQTRFGSIDHQWHVQLERLAEELVS